MYAHIETIYAKLYFMIEASGDEKLLQLQFPDIKTEDLNESWMMLQDAHDKMAPKGKHNKVLDLSKVLEDLKAEHETVRLSVIHLRNVYDDELHDILLKCGYTFKCETDILNNGDYTGHLESLQTDLDEIERLSEGLRIKISAIAKRIPKDDSGGSRTSFEHNILSYGALTHLGYVDSNTITLASYYALIDVGNEKMKSLKSGQTKQNNKRSFSRS